MSKKYSEFEQYLNPGGHLINLDDEGKEIKVFDVQDGFGLVFFKKAGFKTAIISARSAKAVTVRDRDTMKQERIKINKLTDYFDYSWRTKIN